MKRFIIVGLGTFGSSVAETLFEQGEDVVGIDMDEGRVNRMASRVTRAAVGDARQVDVLERLGAREADAGVVSTGDDLSASILAIMALRDLNVAEIYAKVISHEHARIMQKLGVTETIFPERESAINLATRISQSNAILNYVRLADGYSMQEMAVPADWEGKTLRELQIRTHYMVAVIAVHDVLTHRMIFAPDPDKPLKDSDTLLVAGSNENLARVAKFV